MSKVKENGKSVGLITILFVTFFWCRHFLNGNVPVDLKVVAVSNTTANSKEKVAFVEDSFVAVRENVCTFRLPEGATTSPTTRNSSILSNFYNASKIQWKARDNLPACNATHNLAPGVWSSVCGSCDNISTCLNETWAWLREECRERDMVSMWGEGPQVQPQLAEYLSKYTTVFLGDSTLREIFLRMLAPIFSVEDITLIDTTYRHNYYSTKWNNWRIHWNYIAKFNFTQESIIRSTLFHHIPREQLQDRPLVIVIGGTSTYMRSARLVFDICNNNTTNQTWLATNCPWKPEVGGKGIRIIVKSTGSISEHSCCVQKGYEDLKSCPVDLQQICVKQHAHQLEMERQKNELMGKNRYEWFDVFNATASMRSFIRTGDENRCSCHYGHQFSRDGNPPRITWPWSNSRMLDSLANMLAIKLTN